MTSETLLSALGQIDDSLVLEALEEPARPKRTAWRRVALIAACFCLAALPVVAFTKQLWVQPRSDGWVVNISDVRVDTADFSPEVQAAVDGLAPGTNAFLPFDDMAAAEEFLGVPLPENAVLQSARQILANLTDATGREHKTHCLAMLSKNVDGIFGAAMVRAYYSYWGMDVDVIYQLVTKDNPYEDGGGFGWGGYDDAKIIQLAYTTAAGREAQLFVVDDSIPGSEVQNFVGHGYVSVDGVRVELTVRGHYESLVTDTLKEILDAYV